MSIARSKLIESAALLREAAQREDLIAKPPSETHWNEHARLVKAALCISSFTALEEFVQCRIKEAISLLHGFPPSSSALPGALKSALVAGALDSLNARIKDPSRFNISDVNQLIIDHTKKISSFSSAGIDPSDLTLSTNGSNVSWAIVENALSALSIDNPQSVVNGIAKRLEGGIFSAKDHFEGMISWRHKVAHISGSDVPLAQTQDYVMRLPLFCAAFDFALSTGISRILRNRTSGSAIVTKNANIQIRFVEFKSGMWRNRAETSKRAFSRDVDREITRNQAVEMARKGDQCVAIRSSSSGGYVESWSTPFV
ncbi:MAG: HEPN domain-containing protein [Stenotrophomonas maltophilia]